jgi:tripeptidyl-peptidase-1
MLALNALPDGEAPLVHSFSYSDEERQMPPAYVAATDAQFIKAGLRGITLLFASGDDGMAGSGVRDMNVSDPADVEEKCSVHPDWPSSSPYVTCVGGTATGYDRKLRRSVEVASSAATGSRITTGGGFSGMYSRNHTAPWQSSFVEAYLADESVFKPPPGAFNASGRAYPDISGLR